MPIVTENVWNNLYLEFGKQNTDNEIKQLVRSIAESYKINHNTIIKLFFNHLVRHNKDILTDKFLEMVENLMHMKEVNPEYNVSYLICCMKEFATVHNTHSTEQ